jgi:similar to stage IV sporulation protein
MFLTRLLQMLLGYCVFTVEGGSPERFLNLAAHAGISMWNLRRVNDGLRGCAMQGCTLHRNYKRLSPYTQKTGVRLTLTAQKGLPFVFARHQGRWGFLFGFAMFLAIIVYFSGYIWSIEISGNRAVSTREIQYVLSDLGLSPGVRMDDFDSKTLEQKALLKLPGLSFMHINLDGSVARVEVGERARQPEIVPDDRPCNIRASETGQLVGLEVYKGVAMRKIHDTVLKGELVVSGVVEEPKTLVTLFVHAEAKVIARTRRQLSVTVKYKTTALQDTGKIVKCSRLNFLSLQIPFYFKEPQGSWRRMVYKNPLTVLGKELPVSVTTAVFYSCKRVPVMLTRQQAEKKAKTLLTRQEKTEFAGAAIIKRKWGLKAGPDAITLTGSYICEENIALSQEITVLQQSRMQGADKKQK